MYIVRKLIIQIILKLTIVFSFYWLGSYLSCTSTT